MFKKWFLIILFVNAVSFSQESNQAFLNTINTLKSQNNLAEFVYVHLDEFAKSPTLTSIKIIENLPSKVWRSPENVKEVTAFIYYYINYGYYLKEFGQLNEAIIAYEKGFQLYKKNQTINYDIIEYCLKPLANCYTRLGEVERAEDVLKVTLERAQQSKNEQQIVATYLNLSALLRTTGNINSAISYLNVGLKLANKNEDKARFYSDLAINYVAINELDNASKQLAQSKKFNTQNSSSIKMRNAISLGLIKLKLGNLIEAENAFFEGLSASKQLYGNYHREVAKIYVQLANLQLQKQDYDKAQQLFQKGLMALIPTFKPKSLIENPNISSLFSENTLKDIFDGRAATFIEASNSEEALENFELAFAVEEEIRASFLTQNAKILLQQESRRRSEKCIEICFQKYKATNNITWLEKAFEFAELTKNTVVVEAKNIEKEKLKIGKSPLFLKEEKLIFEKAQLTKEIELEQLKGSDATIKKLVALTKSRDAISSELQLLKVEILKTYPQLNTKVDYKVVSSKIESKLVDKNNVFIEFFDGSEHIYRFLIEKNKPISVAKIEKTKEFTSNLEDFLSFFSDSRGTKIQNNIKEYTNVGFKLYSVLFGDTISENVILVPDGLLSFIPFDALLTEKTAIINFEKLPYLINKSKITYAYSGVLLLQGQNRIKNNKSFMGFFPVFEKNYRNLAELSFTQKEATSIQQQLKGTFLMKNEALKKTFEENVTNYSVIHLSTHASAGSFYEPPAIEFYDETLYLPEIYGYNLQTDLMVLSACETGIGTIRKGEGAMSLARAFSYAGVQNLIVSLWKVNDKSTEKIMANFYEVYARNNKKGGSLYQSKLNYLNDPEIASSKKSPYYWASFIYIGQPDSVDASTYIYWWILGGIVLFIVIFVGVKKLVKIKNK